MMSNSFIHRNDKVMTLKGEKLVSELNKTDYVLTPYGFNKVQEIEKESNTVAVNMILATGESVYFTGNSLRFYPSCRYVHQSISRHADVRTVEKEYWEKLASTLPEISEIVEHSSLFCQDLVHFLFSYCAFLPYAKQEKDFFQLFKLLKASDYKQKEFNKTALDLVQSFLRASLSEKWKCNVALLFEREDFATILTVLKSKISFGTVKNCLNSSRHKQATTVRLLLPMEQGNADEFYSIKLQEPVGLFVNRVGIIF